MRWRTRDDSSIPNSELSIFLDFERSDVTKFVTQLTDSRTPGIDGLYIGSREKGKIEFGYFRKEFLDRSAILYSSEKSAIKTCENRKSL